MKLCSIFSAGVSGFLNTVTSSTSRLGSTVIVSSGDGCILALINGRNKRIIPTMIKLYGAKIVCAVEIASETAPPVAS